MDRDETIKGSARKIAEEVKALQEVLIEQKKLSSESEEAMLDMVKDIISKIKNEIEIERKNREASEENLLTLLEGTCGKLQSIAS